MNLKRKFFLKPSIQPWDQEESIQKQRSHPIPLILIFHIYLSIEIRSIDNWFEINWSHSVKLTGYVFLSSSRKFNCRIFSLRLVRSNCNLLYYFSTHFRFDKSNLSHLLSNLYCPLPTHVSKPFCFSSTEHWILVTVHSILFYLISIRGRSTRFTISKCFFPSISHSLHALHPPAILSHMLVQCVHLKVDQKCISLLELIYYILNNKLHLFIL